MLLPPIKWRHEGCGIVLIPFDEILGRSRKQRQCLHTCDTKGFLDFQELLCAPHTRMGNPKLLLVTASGGHVVGRCQTSKDELSGNSTNLIQSRISSTRARCLKMESYLFGGWGSLLEVQEGYTTCLQNWTTGSNDAIIGPFTIRPHEKASKSSTLAPIEEWGTQDFVSSSSFG